MQTGEIITVREYLATSYRPDCDYVDGLVVDRNVGERDHSALMCAVMIYLHERRKDWRVKVLPSLKIHTASTRFRIADICVLRDDAPDEQIPTTAPLMCIEVLGSRDTLSAMQTRVEDFLRMGVPYVFILDPRTRKAWRASNAGLLDISELRTQNPEMVVPLDALYE